MKYLQNYTALLIKVNALITGITAKYSTHISCQKGCDSCCRHLSLSLVEGVAIAVAVAELPQAKADYLRQKARTATADGPCPVLENGECAIYSHRPIICRTHGLPILIVEEKRQRVDFCPKNFINIGTLPGDAVIALDLLNTILAAVNKNFATEFSSTGLAEMERMTIAEALLLKV